MAQMQTNELFKALLLAVMAFESDYTTNQKEEQAERAEMSEAELEDAEDEEYPEEMEEQDFLEKFDDFVSSNGLDTYLTAKVAPDTGKRLEHILSKG